MPADLLILGTEGLAKEAAQLARRIDRDAQMWSSIHYVTHDPSLIGQKRPFGAIDTLDEEVRDRKAHADVVIGIGHPHLRERLALALRANPNLRFPNLIHPQVELDPDLVHLGTGNMIAQGVVLTCDIAIGDFNLLNWNVTIGHDCRIGSYNVINPGSSVSGRVTVGDACLIGTGARILEDLEIANHVVLGAGAVLVRSITASGGTYVGVPARPRDEN